MASGSGSLKRKYDVFSVSGSGSSSAVPTGSWKYEVFLSFRGEDTRYNFVDHLHTALVQRGIFVFKDDEELKTGKLISLELLKAIEESRYAVVVFSDNYANSSWCLAELAKIMECHKELGQKVIPVFYHVDPSDMRGQKNKVAVFFQQHEERFREELDKVKEWRDALTAAANLSGHHISKTIQEGESSYISKIVEEILADRQLSYMESNLVGIDSHMDALSSLLRLEENDKVLIVGIHGMGGIGKTTIAKALFRKIASKFEGSFFVDKVKEKSSTTSGLCALQEKVLREILITNHNFNILDPEDGANIIRARFVRKKICMVLDDVDNINQINFLCATHDSFGPGSRIIITTRNKHLLFGANGKYEPDCLQKHEALKLLSMHAFIRDRPLKGYEELSCRAIYYAGYLPLAVKVLGCFFRGRKKDEWESALNRLPEAPNDDVFNSLKLSYNGLAASEKKIFLDIACFGKGKLVPDITKVLESCGFDPLIGINILIEKSLVTISDNEIGMHDLIQEMGLQIVRESFPNSRLWQLEDIYDSIKVNQNLEKIEAIVMSDEHYYIEEDKYDMYFSPNIFEHMKQLRLLDIRGKFTSSEPTFFSDNLRWLSWSRFPFSSLSMTHMHKLVGLEVAGGTIKQLWNEQQVMPNLKILKLEELDYLTTLPDLSGVPNIETLEVLECKRLKHLPSRFETESLMFLSFNDCPGLKRFPDVSGAPILKELGVYHCKNFVEFHKSLGSHKRIIKLEVIDCAQLKSLPSSLEMESLEYLLVDTCSSLERFPDLSLCMVKLSYIKFDSCSIEGLLSSLGYFSSLRVLDVGRRCKRFMTINAPMCKEYPEKDGCLSKIDTKALESLPNLIGLRTLSKLILKCRPMESQLFLKNLQSFSSLEVLDLSGNNNLIRLPATISHLSLLRKLKLNECHRLQILQGLPSRINILHAHNCYSLEKIDDLSEKYDCCSEICMVNCHKLVKDKDSERYLEKILQESFFKRCYVIDRWISIFIPGNKIPSWFKEAQPGSTIRLMIPPKCDNDFIGIVICAVFPPVEWEHKKFSGPVYSLDFEKDGASFPQNQSHIPNSVLAGEKGNTWLSYLRDLWQVDCSAGGTLLISLSLPLTYPAEVKPVRCAARLIYEEDVESTQQNSFATSMGDLFESKDL